MLNINFLQSVRLLDPTQAPGGHETAPAFRRSRVNNYKLSVPVPHAEHKAKRQQVSLLKSMVRLDWDSTPGVLVNRRML